jgi:hypothetical protein
MKKVAGWLALLVLIGMGSASTVRATNTNLYLQVLPLACSIDTVALGQITSRGITPEDCQPLSLQLGELIVPPPLPNEVLPQHVNAPLVALPASENSPPGARHDVPSAARTPSAKNIEEAAGGSMISGVYPLVAVSLVAMIDMVPTGAFSPLLRRARVTWFWRGK